MIESNSAIKEFYNISIQKLQAINDTCELRTVSKTNTQKKKKQFMRML